MKRIFKLSVFLSLALFANDNMSSLQDSLIKAKKDKSSLDAKIQEESWLGNINLNTSRNRGKNSSSRDFSISLNQDLFKSGGIKYNILKGKILEEISKLEYIKNFKEIDFQINDIVLKIIKSDWELKKNKLLIQNKKFLVDKNEDQYINGLIGINTLNDSLIELNDLKDTQEDLKEQKQTQINNLKVYSNKDYQEIALKNFILPRKKKLFENNIQIKTLEKKLKNNQYDIKITKSNYLPKLSFSANANKSKDLKLDTITSSHNYSFQISIPLEYSFNKKIESSKLTHLIANLELKKKIIEEKNYFDKKLDKIKTLEQKIVNKSKNIQSYQKIYEMTKSMHKHTMKAKSDVIISKNRVNTSSIELKILKLDKQIALNDLYKNYI